MKSPDTAVTDSPGPSRRGGSASAITPADRLAPVEHAIHDLLRARWSPRSFARRPIAPTTLQRVFEAARWAPSSANEQPWRFVLVPREPRDAWERAVACLKPGNRSWAANAPLLVFTFAKTTYTKSGGHNRHAWHDVGGAVAHLTFQALVEGLYLHQMGGFLPDEVRATYRVPDDYQPVTVLALGYLGDGADLSDDLVAKEHRPRTRKPLADLLFAGAFGEPAASNED